MISPTLQQLYDEHETIMAMIDRMRALLDASDRADRGDELREIIAFFREYADGYHHAKEEQVLFPRLRELAPMLESIVGDLTEHHEMFRETLALAESALDAGEWLDLESILDRYASALCDHISAENDELFVVADEMLADADKERIGFLFVDCDEERGVGRKRVLEAYASAV
ncbi:MAG TPA: hemerythrin domain-containing protein [Candidatus Kapabacteria bacterium]|jgi:hemerythrin-like domain-containing protein|nr:hemerythrin domain-containing protein [Candidatus Kapabacteria bacterium]